MKHISIKTIDGSRYDFNSEPKHITRYQIDWLKFSDNGTTRLFQLRNIVSIKETEE